MWHLLVDLFACIGVALLLRDIAAYLAHTMTNVDP